MSEFEVAAIAAVASALLTGLFSFLNVFFSSRESRKMKLIELNYHDAAEAFSEYLCKSGVVPMPVTPEYLAKLTGSFERASLYASERTRPVLERHFLAVIRSPESLEADETAHALKTNELRETLLKSMQGDLSGKENRRKQPGI